MIFLIEYNRNYGKIETIRAFKNSERPAAEQARLEMELGLNTNNGNEIVLLEAENESALRKTHARYFQNVSDLIEIAKTKAFATGLYQGAQLVTQYMKTNYSAIAEGEPGPSGGYKGGAIKRLWIRAYLWMETISRLNDPLDFQAISVANRTLMEILIDLILLHTDEAHESAARMYWWAESEKLQQAEQIINFYSKKGVTVPDEFEAQQSFYANRKSQITEMRKRWWPGRKDPERHPKRWTGSSNLLQDAKRADQLYGSSIETNIGIPLEEYYETQYRKMNWRIHSGLASVGDPPPEAFYLICGFGFKWCADFALLATKITLTEFGLNSDWQDIKRKRDSIFAHELYKTHSSLPSRPAA